MPKRFVLSGYFGFKNFGDEAILSVLVSKLKEFGTDITIITSNPDYTHSLYENINCVRTFDIKNIVEALSKTDFLISGGGSLLQDVTSLKSLIYYLLIIFIALFLHKKVIIFAQGIGPINSSFGRFVTKNILKHCTYLSVRDEKSQELLNNWGIKSDLLCDPIFSLKVPQVQKTKMLAVQLRDCKGMSAEFLDRLSKAVNDNFSDFDIEIYALQDAIDLNICNEFSDKLKALNPSIKTEVYSNLSNQDIISHLSKAQYMVSMRFHSIIIGLLTGVKTLCINYDIKVEKIAKEFDLPVIDLQHDFNGAFENLKNLDTETIKSKTENHKFDWSGFEKVIE